MRTIIGWLTANDNPRTTFESRTGASQRRRHGLTLEPLEVRTLFTVAVTPIYAVTNDWSSGFQADLRLESHQAASIAPWKLDFDLSSNITSIWNAKITGHSGNHYTVEGAGWNDTLSGNGVIDFGFVAAGDSKIGPGNYLLNGNALSNTTAPVLPTVSIGDAAVTEGQNGTIAAVFTVGLSAPSATVVSVKFGTADGTALAGSDYQATSGTLSFAAGQTVRTVSVLVSGDAAVEPDEAFYVILSGPSGANLAQSRGTGTIKNDDTPPAPPAQPGIGQFQVSSDWGSGFTAQVTVRNSGAAVNNWQVEFDFAGTITSIWDGKIVSHTGNHYVLQNAGYNSSVAAGASLSFGFNGTRATAAIVPTNYTLHAAGGDSTPANHAPVAATDFAFTSPGTAVVINALANDTGPDGDALTIIAVAQAAHGTVALESDSTIKYTPAAGFTGNDAFTYQLRDAHGATATGNVSLSVAAASAWPAHVYAPYVDMGLYPTYDLVSAAQSQGLRYFSLAFVVADAAKQPSWGGYTEYELGTTFDAQVKSQINALRALGGDVVVSFGGASGQELAQVITDGPALVRAYQAVIDAYGLTHIDFDIEGAASADHASIDRRNQAIAQLQSNAAAAGRTLDVSYTLPVLPTGLTADGLYVVQSAVRLGVNIGLVNVMAMDYGDSAAPNPQGHMGDYAIAAANSLFTQLKSVYGTAKTDAQLWQMVGVTPMIGLNDATTEVFDQQEARELVAFAQQHGIGRIAIWSLNRDQQNTAGKLNYVDLKSSSIVQQPFEFSQIFRPFTS